MKSLEHIIRLVHEGQCSCEKKKKSLEHTIRDVGKNVDENVKTDTVTKGIEILMHDPAHTLGQLVPYGKQALKTIEKNLPAVVTKTKLKTELPAVVKTTPKTEVPVATQTATQVVTKPETQTVTKTQPVTATPVVTPTTTAPQKSMADAMASAMALPVGYVASKIASKTVPASVEKAAVATAPVTATKTETKVAAVEPPKGGKPSVAAPFGIIPMKTGSGIGKGDFFDSMHMFRPPTITHKAKKRMMAAESVEERKEIENMPRSDKDRKDVRYVGREEDDVKTIRSKTARNAEIKHKIIDESRKVSTLIKKVRKDAKEFKEDGNTKVYPNVIINPDLNRVDLNTYIDSGKKPNDYK